MQTPRLLVQTVLIVVAVAAFDLSETRLRFLGCVVAFFYRMDFHCE